MEIERYTLISGESVFVGLARKLKSASPLWFIFSTFIPWIWPGIIAASATLLAQILNIPYSPLVPIGLLLLIGIILSLGPVLYKTQEIFQKTLIFIGVPFILILTFWIAQPTDWQSLAQGLIGKGHQYWFLPIGIPLATLLGAFAYSGAGGNLNLAQSFYIKEKGYGMGKYSGRLTSLLTGKTEKVKLTGATFPLTKTNLTRFRVWWRNINREHLIVFWFTGLITMLTLSLLAYSTLFPTPFSVQGISFLSLQSQAISQLTLPLIGTIFLVVATLMLFSTQFSILDATSRILTENLMIFRRQKNPSLSFYTFLWLQIIAGIIIFSLGFTEPLTLIIIGAVLNAVSMFVYSGLILWLNLTNLPKQLKPNLARSFMVFLAFLFYGSFSLLILFKNI